MDIQTSLSWVLLAATPFHLEQAGNNTGISPEGQGSLGTLPQLGHGAGSSEPGMPWNLIPFISFLEETHKKQKCRQASDNFSFWGGLFLSQGFERVIQERKEGKEGLVSGGGEAVTELKGWMHLQGAESKQNIGELQLPEIKNMLIGNVGMLVGAPKKPWMGNE